MRYIIVLVVYIFRNFNQYIFTKFNNKNNEDQKGSGATGQALAKRTCS